MGDGLFIAMAALMASLEAAIHLQRDGHAMRDGFIGLDGRVKPGHDVWGS
jgi:hypothetical protein